MNDQTKALIYRYLTGAAVAALGGAIGAATTMLQAGPVTDVKVLAAAMAAGAGLALRLWLAKESPGFFSIFGIEKSLGDKLAAPPDEYLDEGGILFKALLPAITSGPLSLAGLSAPPSMVEIRKFSDPRLQEAIDHAFQVAQSSGQKSGAFFNVNLNGEIRSGVAIKIGGHLSIGGFLEKKPGLKLEGLAEVTFAF